MKMNKWLLLSLILALSVSFGLILGACGDDDDDDDNDDESTDDDSAGDDDSGDDDSSSSSLEEAVSECEDWYETCFGTSLGADLVCGVLGLIPEYNECVETVLQDYLDCLTASECGLDAYTTCGEEMSGAAEDCY